MIVAFENWQSTRTAKPLAPGQVHLWRAPLEVSPEMRVTLSHDDWIESRRFHYEDEREHFIATRGLLRLILARYLASQPMRAAVHHWTGRKAGTRDTLEHVTLPSESFGETDAAGRDARARDRGRS
jgi:4'-phosphopantetheinyl transferase